MRFYRYGRWDGTQEISPFDPDEIMESLADDLLGDGDVRSSLQRILQRGFQNRDGERTMGLQQLLERLRNQRQQQLDRYDMGGILDQIKEMLEDVLRMEREGIQRRLDETRNPPASDANQAGADSDQQPQGSDQPSDAGQQSNGPEPQGTPSPSPASAQQGGTPGSAAPQGQSGSPQQTAASPQSGTPGEGQPSSGGQSGATPSLQQMLENIAARKQAFLDELPPDPGGAIKALNDYEFMDPEAREKFQELLRLLQQQMMQSYFQGMQQGMQSMTPQDLQAAKQMLQDLNQMLRDRAEGREPDFDQFMQKHGQNFPPGIENLDQLMQHMQQRMGQMQALLQSMSPEQRGQLEDMARQLMDQAGMADELAEMAELLDELMPRQGQGQRPYPFHGDEPLSMLEAMQLMDELQQMDGLERQLQQARNLDNVDQVDVNQLRRLLGEEAAQSMEQLRELQKRLEDAGYVTRRGNELELTAKGMRRIGEKALQDIFQHLKRSAFGKHPMAYRGSGGERTDDAKPYEFGDPFTLDMQKTLMNSVVREGPGTPMHLIPEDFEVYRHELVTQSSTVILLDMSRSMFFNGCILAAKKVAVALNSLIKGLYPRDNLYILAFSMYARQVQTQDLPGLSWNEWGHGTNMQHAFMESRRLLARHKGGTKQIIMVTDGEPTSWFEPGSPWAEFEYPPPPNCIRETLREVGRCTRDDITINTFMMERGRYLEDFVAHMTKINKGRAFYATPERLGEYILVDYVDHKRKNVR